MAIKARIKVTPPALADGTIWFANATAWNNYWKNVYADVEVDELVTNKYTPVPFDTTLDFLNVEIDGEVVKVVTEDQVNSLKAQIDALDTAVRELRTALKAGGLITEAQ
jgi:hypothetical protein